MITLSVRVSTFTYGGGGARTHLIVIAGCENSTSIPAARTRNTTPVSVSNLARTQDWGGRRRGEGGRTVKIEERQNRDGQVRRARGSDVPYPLDAQDVADAPPLLRVHAPDREQGREQDDGVECRG